MTEYRVYVIGPDGLSKSSVLLDCDADGAAIESAKQFRCDHDIELWQRDRKIARLGPRTVRMRERGAQRGFAQGPITRDTAEETTG